MVFINIANRFYENMKVKIYISNVDKNHVVIVINLNQGLHSTEEYGPVF